MLEMRHAARACIARAETPGPADAPAQGMSIDDLSRLAEHEQQQRRRGMILAVVLVTAFVVIAIGMAGVILGKW